jgi:NADPH:quinone reductase-like Zn-dependent oxidoreductase
MKAIVYKTYGNPEVLSLAEVEKPVPKENEVLIKVHAVSINDWDLGLLNGDFINRMISGIRKPRKTILGSDIAGTIEAVGQNVTLFSVGDQVYGDLSGVWGGFAEYVCALETQVARKLPQMTFEEAAAIPQAAMLAVQGLIDVGQIKTGQKILINGAGGGVGTFGLQIAKLFQTEVTGVDHTIKLEMMKSLGFDHVVDYTKTDFTKSKTKYDLILDAKTDRSIFEYTRVLTTNGTYVTVGGLISKLLQTFVIGSLYSKLQRKKIKIVALKPNKDLPYINELYNAGKLKPVIDQCFPLSKTVEAMTYYQSGKHKGKVVITNSAAL